uniref:Uncharacterized protein n=1 Tax=Spumella elongata TaxID=89044 RepID=A0A7S3HSC3_9STRA|mmetsp:Transcript_7488/g.12623  ORF Transcript_7488/g.12623 Transcript_7488/m.12623 type:complete len:290 (+) Transcript_7488:52-921(+)
MNSRPSTESLGLSETQDREDDERPEDFEEGEEDEDDNDDDDDEGDDGNDGEEGDDAVGSQYTGVSELERFARASASGLDKPTEDQLTADGLSGKKRERSNAKAVECLDMDGNLVELFRSGMSASMKLGIPQGDISLCCRGLKSSVMGYKFRFYGETAEKQALRLKKGFVLEGIGLDNNMKVEMTRTTRASRGEYGQGRGAGGGYDAPGRSLLDPPELKSRKWHQEIVRAGPFLVTKWIPSTAEPTPALHSRIPKNAAEAKLNKSKRRRTVNRLSIGSTAPSKYVYDEHI